MRKPSFCAKDDIWFALVCSILLAVVLFGSFFIGGQPGAIDFGEYDAVIASAGLTRTQWDLEHPEERYYIKPVEQFDYLPFSYAKLLTHPAAPSVVYPIALIRLVTEPFGLGFSTLYLFILYSVILIVSAYHILRYCFIKVHFYAAIPALFIFFIFSNNALLAYLNSLYSPAAAMTAFMAYLACLCCSLLRRNAAIGFLSLFCGYLLVNAQPELIVLLPAVLVTSAGIIYRNRNGQTGYILIGAIAFVLITHTSITHFVSSIELNSDTSSYHATFLGLLKHSPDPKSDLIELGLSTDYMSDIGKSYFELDSTYAHNPRDAGEASILFPQINPSKRLSIYFRHPDRMINAMKAINNSAGGYGSARISASIGITERIMNLLNPNGAVLRVIALAVVLLGTLVLLFRQLRHGSAQFSSFCLFWALGALSYPIIRIWLCGEPNIDLAKVVFIFFGDCAVCVIVTAAARIVDRILLWTGEEVQVIKEPVLEQRTESPNLMYKGLLSILNSQKRTLAAVMIVAIVMASYLLFSSPRAGGVNNGDFGRMMDQIDLFWTDDIATNPDTQAGRTVIETYTFRRAFDFRKLTVLNAQYSLIYPASLVRLYSLATDQLFHTNYLSYIFAVVTLLCIWSIVLNLYPKFKRWTLALGLVITIMLISEIYFVWFNSLFGEGSIYLGLLMTIACALMLINLPKDKGRKWVFLLAFSVRFLLTAKAQMTVALPVGLLLIIVFAFYHKPIHKRKSIIYVTFVMVTCVVISLATISVYRANDKVSSRQTLWQSVFYGLLMSTDDPDSAMQELGIDPRMKPDIGKHAYFPDEEYVFALMSEEAKTGFYDRVNMFSVMLYYLRHPRQLLFMLDRAAQQSINLHDGFMAYVGQRYDEYHDPINRLTLWKHFRPMLACRTAWQYAILYLIAAGWWLRHIIKKDSDGRKRMYAITMLAILVIGALQFPLTVIGNGYADNNKQLFAFMLCHDFLMIVLVFDVLRSVLGSQAIWTKRLKLKKLT